MKTRALRRLLSLTGLMANFGMASLCIAAQQASPPLADCPSAAEVARLTVDRPVAVMRPRWKDAGPGAVNPDVPPLGLDATPSVTLRDEISVHVSGLDRLLAREKCAPSAGRIVLYLEGRPLASASPYPPVDPTSETLRFVLDRHVVPVDAKKREESREVWTHLVGRPSFSDRQLTISVGLQNEYPIPSDQVVMLQTIPPLWFWIWSVLLVVLICVFVTLAVRSDVLRDVGPPPGTGIRKPYSLAKMQAAWWFFLILASYLFIGLVTGDYGTTITGTVLSLMGISAATAVGSATIDAGRPPAGAAPAAAGPAAAAVVAVHPTAGTKGHWWLDILSDEHGVNFHRFQMACWTVVLGVIFIHEVYAGLAMPVFDTALLGLLGISAGTYLGLKTTGEKSAG